MKRKQVPRKRKLFLKVTLVLCLLLYGFLAWHSRQVEPPVFEETIVISPDETVVSVHEYTDMVMYTISGYLTDQDKKFDLYYEIGSTGLEKELESTCLLADGRELINPYGGGSYMDYTDLHVYSFLYYVGASPRRIEFSIDKQCDGYEGQYTLHIKTVLYSGGR